jgi:hypothetical protein
MNNVVIRIGAISPILEIELEIIKSKIDLKENLTLYKCNDKVPTCFWNNSRVQQICNICKSKFNNGLNLLELEKKIIIKNFDLSEYSKIEIKYPKNVGLVSKFIFDKAKLGIGVLSSLVSKYKDHQLQSLPKKVYFREIELAVKTYLFFLNEWKDKKPDKIYIFNGRITEYFAIKAVCEKLNINFFVYETAQSPEKYVLQKNSTVHDFGNIKKEISKKIYLNKKIRLNIKKFLLLNNKKKNLIKLDLFPHLNFTKKMKQNHLPNKFDYSKRNIVIFNTSIDERASLIDPNNNKIIKNTIYSDDNVGIIKILNYFKNNNNFFFYIRAHPNLSSKNYLFRKNSQIIFLEQIKNNFNNAEVIMPDSIVDSYALMRNCEKVLTFGSSMGAESTYWGKPSILLNRAFYEDEDCVYEPRSHQEAVKLISFVNLKPKNSNNCMRYFYYSSFFGLRFKYFVFRDNQLFFKGKKIKVSFFYKIINLIIYFTIYLPKKFVTDPRQFIIYFNKKFSWSNFS